MNAIAGKLIRLPCFVRPLGPADSISLVLWYRGEDISGTPIYSVDARYTAFSNAQYFAQKDYQSREVMNFTLNTVDSVNKRQVLVDESTIGDNLKQSDKDVQKSHKVKEKKSSSTAHLYLMPVIESDAGLYWCRVDYKWERTTISTVTMNVIGK